MENDETGILIVKFLLLVWENNSLDENR